jgi:hypothetical protein
MSLRYTTRELEQQALEYQASVFFFLAGDLKQSRKLVKTKSIKKGEFLAVLDTAISLAEELADTRKREAAKLEIALLFAKKRRGGRPRKKTDGLSKRPIGRPVSFPKGALIRLADRIDQIKTSNTDKKITDAEAIMQFLLNLSGLKGKSQHNIQHLVNKYKTRVSRGRKLRRERQKNAETKFKP